MVKRILIKDYAKLKNQTLSNIYQKVKRGTLISEKIDGKTYIVENIDKPKKPKKCKCKKAKKHYKEKIKNLEALLKSKEAEIETLKISFNLLSTAFNKQLKSVENAVIDAEIKPTKKTSKKDKDKNLKKKRK